MAESSEVRTLSLLLRVGGAAMVAFFVAAAAAVLLDVNSLIDESAGVLGRLGAWSDHEGYEYVLMLSAIYIVWGIFVWRAAADPLANASLVQFTIAGNFAHMAVMGAMALTDDEHRLHLVGDVPLGLALPIALLWAWRRAVASTAADRAVG